MLSFTMKKKLVQVTAARFRAFIEDATKQMDGIIERMETGDLDPTCSLDALAEKLMRQFVDTGHANTMREIAEKARNIDERANVVYLNDADLRELSGELADILEQFEEEKKELSAFGEQMHAAVRARTEMN